MNELLEKDQVISVVPQNFKNSNKGKVVRIFDEFFSLKLFHKPEGIEPKKIMELYSQTKNGMLYFTASIIKVEDDGTIVVSIPRKHRFLQRRTFTRVKFNQEVSLELDNKKYKASCLDLSAGGIKLLATECLDIDAEYNIDVELINGNFVKCKFLPIKIEKNESGSYTVSGRFKDIEHTDVMKVVQFCIRKDIENLNR